MANKCFRKCLRSGLLFFIQRQPPASSAAAADRKLCTELQNLQELYIPHDPAAALPSSARCSRRSMHASASHSACLPLHLSGRALPSSSSSPWLHAAEADDLGYGNLQHVDYLQLSDPDHKSFLSGYRHHKLKRRSHSCSKLTMVPSFKSLLHRTRSHGHLNGRHYSQTCSGSRLINKLHTGEKLAGSLRSGSAVSSLSCENDYTRSWRTRSSPSLRHMKKEGSSSSFHGELQATGSSKGKRAPKGHVAVYVEGGRERHVVPIAYLSHPHFQELLQKAESEFGFAQKGGLLLPCTLSELQDTLSLIRLDQNHVAH